MANTTRVFVKGIHTVDLRFPNQCRIPHAYSGNFVLKPFIDSFLVGSGAVRKPHHKRQFSDFANMRNALQSRRDYMFIVPNVRNLFRSYGAKETIIRFSINISSLRD